ncbi:glycosyltransferase family 1 protein [Massilia sp. RP-1-19]|uniref:Glycosyltransferase family 1 protein n=1 Tax=Massilia polaris TaxID=2728846 RepID=A0A848HM07_9BURK|nr:glycosyltransferase [Massilia polaris]NML62232.1 glycosyltransferase family 1 protein [Massilia polaris]
MHIADITMFYAARGGGVSTYLNAKARWLLQRTRIRHTILSPNVATTDGKTRSLVTIPSIPFPGIHGYRIPLSVAGAARILQGLEPDLIEAGDAGHCAWAALRVKRRLNIPAVAFYHSDLPRIIGARMGDSAERAARSYLAHLYRQFDLVMAPSKLMVQQLDNIGVRGVFHQPLGIDIDTFSPKRRANSLRDHLNLAPETRLLVYAGRFTAEKKLPILIEAVRRLGHPYHLLLIGGGVTLPPLDRVTCLPFKRNQQDLARLLGSSDVLVHPGDRETFGLIVLEAMACGTPVVGTTGGSVAELVEAGTGILVEPNSVARLCEGIDAIYRCDMDQLGKNALRHARARYDWHHIMPQMLQRYAGLLATRERAELEAERIFVAE